MSFHAGQSFTFGETPSATKWNYLWENDYALADGTGISDNAIDSRHYVDGSVDPEHLASYDWFKRIPGYAYSSVVAGTWARLGTAGTGGIGSVALGGSNGAQNEEVQYKVVLQAGTYSLYLYADKDINRGIYTISIDGGSVGTADGYAGTRVAGEIFTISTTITIATSKQITVNVKMATKHASSSAYYARLYELLFVRTA